MKKQKTKIKNKDEGRREAEEHRLWNKRPVEEFLKEIFGVEEE